MSKSARALVWVGVTAAGVLSVATIAIHRGEEINAMWLVVAAVCSYTLGYRFYSKFIAAKVLTLDALRATPAERLENGRDFVRTNKWVVFGHPFAAIAGPGPLVGPVLAAQFGYLPGTLWILTGAVFAGCVQDFVILLFSVRRDGKSLTEMAKDEIGRLGGLIAYVAVISIIIILLGVCALIVVNALKASPWGTFTIAMTIPIALLMGVYLRRIRPGKVLESSVLGFLLVLLAIWGGQWASHTPSVGRFFRGVRVAGLASARAPRLPEHLRQARHDCDAGIGNRCPASHAAHAGSYALHRWHRSGVCRKSLSVCLRDHRLRRHQRLSLADRQRYHPQADFAGDRDAHGGIRRYGV